MGRGPEETFYQRRHTNGQQVHEKVLNITNHQGNVNQNHKEISKWLLSKALEMTSIDEDVDKRDPLYTIGRNVNWCNHYGKQYVESSKN